MDGAPETENTKPLSNFQKMQRRLARQKQPEDMHTRGRSGSGSETEEKAGLVARATKEGQRASCDVEGGGSLIQVFEYSPYNTHL